MVVNATGGIVSLDALTMAGADYLAGKPLLDLSNALDHSVGFPPDVGATQTESNAERIQAAFPAARVVKCAQHDEQLADGRPRVSCPARTPRSWPATTRRRRRSRAACCATWAGPTRRSSTSVT